MKDLHPVDDPERQNSAVRHHHRPVVLSGQPRRQRRYIDRAPAVGLLPVWPPALRFWLGRCWLVSRRPAVAREMAFLWPYDTARERGSTNAQYLPPREPIRHCAPPSSSSLRPSPPPGIYWRWATGHSRSVPGPLAPTSTREALRRRPRRFRSAVPARAAVEQCPFASRYIA